MAFDRPRPSPICKFAAEEINEAGNYDVRGSVRDSLRSVSTTTQRPTVPECIRMASPDLRGTGWPRLA